MASIIGLSLSSILCGSNETRPVALKPDYSLVDYKEGRKEFFLCDMVNAKPHLHLNLGAVHLL
jgi:hypothetical protein